MFESLKGMAGLAGLMKDLPRMKEKFEEVKDRLETIQVFAETGGGAVRVVATCKLRIISVQVDPSMMGGLIDADAGDEDRALAEELIAGAINAALEKAQQRATEEFTDAASELGLPLPPGGLGGMF